jgi:hypothetical protein
MTINHQSNCRNSARRCTLSLKDKRELTSFTHQYDEPRTLFVHHSPEGKPQGLIARPGYTPRAVGRDTPLLIIKGAYGRNINIIPVCLLELDKSNKEKGEYKGEYKISDEIEILKAVSREWPYLTLNFDQIKGGIGNVSPISTR